MLSLSVAGKRNLLLSLLGGALIAASLSLAHASPGSGSGGGDDDFDVSDHDDDHEGPGGGNDDDWEDNSGHRDDDLDDDNDDDRGDNSGSGHGGDNDDRSGGRDNSGSGRSGSHDDRSGSRDGSSGSGSDASRRADAGAGALSAADHHNVYMIEVDDFGQEYVSRELLLAGNAQDIRRARSAGFEIIGEQRLATVDMRLVRLRLPSGVSPHESIARLRTLTPSALVSVNSIYRGAQSLVDTTTARPAPRRTPLPSSHFTTAMGIIDTGVYAQNMQSTALVNHVAFAGPRPVAHEHGSTVAAIATEHGARVHVADVFGQSADGRLAASAENIAAALDWMIAHDVAVINISIQGPDNPIIAQLVRRAAERGHVVVAAAGNEGPMARPAFPAAFDGVLAVTAIDDNGRPYLRANRGAYIDFAARGVDVDVMSGDEQVIVSGTSFAAPVVAARIAAELRAPSPRDAARIVASLQAGAEDLGAPGRDPIYGWGALRD
jgi:minor extracellular protease Epr